VPPAMSLYVTAQHLLLRPANSQLDRSSPTFSSASLGSLSCAASTPRVARDRTPPWPCRYLPAQRRGLPCQILGLAFAAYGPPALHLVRERQHQETRLFMLVWPAAGGVGPAGDQQMLVDASSCGSSSPLRGPGLYLGSASWLGLRGSPG
jgi:hypothetical protein